MKTVVNPQTNEIHTELNQSEVDQLIKNGEIKITHGERPLWKESGIRRSSQQELPLSAAPHSRYFNGHSVTKPNNH